MSGFVAPGEKEWVNGNFKKIIEPKIMAI